MRAWWYWSRRLVDAALTLRSGPDEPREVVTYARNRWGSSATRLNFTDIHPKQPPVLARKAVRGASYDVRDVLRSVLSRNSSSLIALKLDVEGDEFWMLDALSREPALLCAVSYLFVEFHNLPGMRANLSGYGLDADMYEVLKRQIHPRAGRLKARALGRRSAPKRPRGLQRGARQRSRAHGALVARGGSAHSRGATERLAGFPGRWDGRTRGAVSLT